MKNNFSVAILALALTSLTVTVASAHPPPPPHPHHCYHGGCYGPGFFPPVVVISTGESDDSVSMVGHVFRKTGDDTYLFTDGTNTFHLVSDNSDLPVGPTIVIGGRFDDNQVDIRKWHYAE
jgi:uncharacterized protein YdeI (BOF family)